jgi:hypothetical protein
LWKLGVKFLWGPRGRFDFTFSQQLDAQWERPAATQWFLLRRGISERDLAAALMRATRFFREMRKVAGLTFSRGTVSTSRTANWLMCSKRSRSKSGVEIMEAR